MTNLADLEPDKRRKAIKQDRHKAVLGALGGAATLGAVGLRAAPLAAKGVLRQTRVHVPRARVTAQRVLANEEKYKDRSNATFLVGSVPSGSSSLMTARDTYRDTSIASRKLREDNTLRARPVPLNKSDNWRDYVSDDAAQAYTYLRRGAQRDLAQVGGTALGAVGATTALLSRTKKAKVAGGLMAAATAANAPGAREAAKRRTRWNDKADAIQRRGEQRRDDVVGKALLRPTSMVLGTAMRRSGVVRLANGKQISRRGAYMRNVRPGGL